MRLGDQLQAALDKKGIDERIWAWQLDRGELRLITDQPNDFGLDELAEWLDQEVDPGYGGSDHRPMWAWTENFVIVEAVYDGSTWFEVVPRHPTTLPQFAPRFIGGQ